MVQDIKAGSLRTAVLTELHGGTEYELKVRPYYSDFQGLDSEITVVRIPDKGIKCHFHVTYCSLYINYLSTWDHF